MGQIRKLVVTLETVTPLFLAGADGKTPELRAASLRGALRFWLRALLGAHIGDNLDELRRQESVVFGGTDGASPVVVRISPISLPEPESINFSLDSGMGYLLWAITRTERTAYPASSTRFTVTLSTRPMRHDENTTKAFRHAIGALWLLIHLGGVGMRTRRGLGSLRVTDVAGWPDDLPSIQTEDHRLPAHLASGITNLQDALGLPPSGEVTPPTPFDVLHPAACSIYFRTGPSWTDWSTALDDIGNALRGFRDRRPPDHDGVQNVIKGKNPPSTVKRAAFGLPMQFYYRGLNEDYARELQKQNPGLQWRQAMRKTRHMASADVSPAGRDFERRASPLHFKVAWLNEGELTGILTFFESSFLEYQKVHIAPRDRKKQTHNVDAPDYQMIRDFLAQLQWRRVFGG